MDKIIEILRRFTIAIIWVVGTVISVGLLIGGYSSNDNLMINFGIGSFILIWVLSKLVNWIFGDKSS